MLREALLAGVGALYMTKDKAEEISQQLIERGELAKEEKNDFVSKLMHDVDKQKSDMKSRFKREFNSMVKESNLITRDEYDELLSRIDDLSAKISELEK
jgi:polyhydroxyalkanoate synthesis regulator phasin